MKKNVGNIDKIIRIIIAVVAAYFAYTTVSPWNYVLYAVAGIMVFTTFLGSCPIYSVFGCSTCKVEE